MSKHHAFLSACLLSVFFGGAAAATGAEPAAKQAQKPPQGWQAFWKSVKVDPAPPPDFLEMEYTGRVENFTGGKLSEETARQWARASVRRAMGDLYAIRNLREDIANADVFGPPGLNGTLDGIHQLRAQGLERIEAPMMGDFIGIGVIAVSQKMRAENPDAQLTDYVIVSMFRPKQADATLVYRDGRTEVLEGGKAAGDQVSWQLDAGHYYEHPTLGPLWYQSMGWSCEPAKDHAIGQLCGLMKP